MPNRNLFRISGWSAILFILCIIAIIIIPASAGGGIFLVVSLLTTLFSIIVFYGLYIFHRPQAAVLSLSMLILGIIALILEDLSFDPISPLGLIRNGMYVVAFLLVGYLGYNNSQMPRWLAVCAYGVGGLSLMQLGLFALGLNGLGYGVFPFLIIAAWIVWSAGIWRWFLRMAMAQ